MKNEEIAELMRQHQRYPYTYAADYLREKVGNDYDKGIMSRSASSRVRGLIASAMSIPDEAVATALAELYIMEHGEGK